MRCLLNAGAALYRAGKADTLFKCIELASETVDNGNAGKNSEVL
jgi:anthranilate phosphoribosyltransferase